MRLTKAVFPVAGMGTRFLPATKSIPKEMLPIIEMETLSKASHGRSAAAIAPINW